MDEHDKSFLWMVIITTMALTIGIAFAILDRQDITNYNSSSSPY